MKIQEQRQGAVTVIRPEGPLIESDAAAFRAHVEEVRRSSMGRFVVDLGGTPFVDSRGLEAMVEITEAMADVGQALRICALNDTLREVLDVTDLISHFEHYDDVNSAVRSFL